MRRKGAPLYLTQTHKNGKRYGYYVSKALTGGAEENASGWRLPAQTLERAVINAIINLLRSEERLFTKLDAENIDIAGLERARAKARDLCLKLSSSEFGERKTALRRVLDRIEISPDKIKLSINRRGLNEAMGLVHQHAEGSYNEEVPIRLQRCGVEAKLVIEGESASQVNPNLCRMIAQAHCWFQQLATGAVASVREIAKHENVRESEITRILRLAFLSPKVVRNILEGRQPNNVTTHRLRRLSALPLDWAEQETTIDNLGRAPSEPR